MAQLLGQWFREAGNTVQKHGGVIDKFIGDAILAYWQENPGPPRECMNAYKAAQHLLDLAAKIKWPESGKQFTVGIAVHMAGWRSATSASSRNVTATIIGNAVNTAFRLESVMKELGQRLLVSEDMVNALDESERALFTDLGEKSLKGKSEVVRVFGIAI